MYSQQIRVQGVAEGVAEGVVADGVVADGVVADGRAVVDGDLSE
jgi:hypothetical protein